MQLSVTFNVMRNHVNTISIYIISFCMFLVFLETQSFSSFRKGQLILTCQLAAEAECWMRKDERKL